METDKQNIKVAVRIRPFSPQEIQEKQQTNIEFLNFKSLAVVDKQQQKHNFYFDFVGNEYTNQEQIFEQLAKPLCISCLQGYNASIFAYGQTGAGKTYTISGNDDAEEQGMLPRSLEFLFQQILQKQRNPNIHFKITCSFLEIYNEQILDLLNRNSTHLQVREDQERGIYVENLKEIQVNNYNEAQKYFRLGKENRHVAETNMNLESSRSHTVFTLNIRSSYQDRGLTQKRQSMFNFVDLAGSERHTLIDNNQRLKEGCNINKSLHVLGSVINAQVDIQEGRQRHVHYRDSKLTLILKDCLGGNSKTVITACIGPSIQQLQETLSSLKFAKRAKFIKSVVRINEDFLGDNEALKNEIKRLRQQLDNKDQLILDNKLKEQFRYYQELFNEFQVKNLDSLEKCDKILSLFQQKEMQYKLVMDLLHQKLKRKQQNTESWDTNIQKIIQEYPLSIQFQEEIHDLRVILSMKIKQQKEDDLILKSEKYIQELMEIFQKLDDSQQQNQRIRQLEEQNQLNQNQIQLITLENIQLENKIQNSFNEKEKRNSQIFSDQIKKLQVINQQQQDQLDSIINNNNLLQQKYNFQNQQLEKTTLELQECQQQCQIYQEQNDGIQNQLKGLQLSQYQKQDEIQQLSSNVQNCEQQIELIQEEKKIIEMLSSQEIQNLENLYNQATQKHEEMEQINKQQLNQINNLSQEEQNLRDQLQNKQNSILKQELTIQDLQAQQDVQQTNYQQLKQSYEQLSQDNRLQISQTNEKSKCYQSQLDEKEVLVQQMTKQLHQVLLDQGKNTQDYLQKFDMFYQQIEEHKLQNHNFQEQLQNLNDELNKKNNELEMVKNILANEKEQVIQLQLQIKNNQEVIRTEQLNIEELNSKINQNEKDINDKKELLEFKQNQIQNQQNQIGKIEYQKQEMEKLISNQVIKLEDMCKIENDQNIKIQNLNQKVDEYSLIINDNKQQLSKNQNQNQNLESQNTKYLQQINEQNKQLDDLQTKLNVLLNNEIENLQKIEEFNKSILQLQNQNQNYEQELQQIQEEKAYYKNTLIKNKNEKQDFDNYNDQQIEQLNHELQRVYQDFKQLENQHNQNYIQLEQIIQIIQQYQQEQSQASPSYRKLLVNQEIKDQIEFIHSFIQKKLEKDTVQMLQFYEIQNHNKHLQNQLDKFKDNKFTDLKKSIVDDNQYTYLKEQLRVKEDLIQIQKQSIEMLQKQNDNHLKEIYQLQMKIDIQKKNQFNFSFDNRFNQASIQNTSQKEQIMSPRSYDNKDYGYSSYKEDLKKMKFQQAAQNFKTKLLLQRQQSESKSYQTENDIDKSNIKCKLMFNGNQY